jgi:hypothetical protein
MFFVLVSKDLADCRALIQGSRLLGNTDIEDVRGTRKFSFATLFCIRPCVFKVCCGLSSLCLLV